MLTLILLTNFVLVMTDDQRADTIGAIHGLGGPAMPIVQAMAAQGMTFTNARTVDSLCSPSRASLLSGLYVHNHGVIRNNPPRGGATAFDPSSTLATWLHDAGYRTAFIGKYINDYSAIAPQIPPGWDDWRVFVEPRYYNYDLVENATITHHGSQPFDYSTDVLASRATRFIEDSVARGKPFFLYFATFAPHTPSIPAPRHIGAFSNLPNWRPASWNEADMSDKPQWARALPLIQQPIADVLDAFRRSQMEADLAVDEAVGQIMDTLISTNAAADTMLIFMSDNGMSWGEHRWGHAKLCGWEECVRVPMVVWKPGLVPSGVTDDHLVLNIDIAPTIAALAGASTPYVNGSNMAPLFSGGAWRVASLAEHWANLTERDIPRYDSITDDRWKLIDNMKLGENEELYDLLVDPLELQNVASRSENAGIKADLFVKLQDARSQ